MKSIANHSLKSLGRDLKDELEGSELSCNMITRAYVKAAFSSIKLPEDIESAIRFLITDCNDDDNCLKLGVELTLLG